jgi:hypothetical protein
MHTLDGFRFHSAFRSSVSCPSLHSPVSFMLGLKLLYHFCMHWIGERVPTALAATSQSIPSLELPGRYLWPETFPSPSCLSPCRALISFNGKATCSRCDFQECCLTIAVTRACTQRMAVARAPATNGVCGKAATTGLVPDATPSGRPVLAAPPPLRSTGPCCDLSMQSAHVSYRGTPEGSAPEALLSASMHFPAARTSGSADQSPVLSMHPACCQGARAAAGGCGSSPACGRAKLLQSARKQIVVRMTPPHW